MSVYESAKTLCLCAFVTREINCLWACGYWPVCITNLTYEQRASLSTCIRNIIKIKFNILYS
jgi:hypothetical protein